MNINLKSLCQKLAAISLALLLCPSILIAEEALFGHGPQPKTPPKFNDRSIKYVDGLSIGVIPEVEPAFGKPLPNHIIKAFSALGGVKLKYQENLSVSHVFKLPNRYYEAEVEAICKKIKLDSRVKWCGPNYRFRLNSATAPNDPVYSNGQQWNLRDESPAGINAADAWKLSPGVASTVIAILDGGLVPLDPEAHLVQGEKP